MGYVVTLERDACCEALPYLAAACSTCATLDWVTKSPQVSSTPLNRAWRTLLDSPFNSRDEGAIQLESRWAVQSALHDVASSMRSVPAAEGGERGGHVSQALVVAAQVEFEIKT